MHQHITYTPIHSLSHLTYNKIRFNRIYLIEILILSSIQMYCKFIDSFILCIKNRIFKVEVLYINTCDQNIQYSSIIKYSQIVLVFSNFHKFWFQVVTSGYFGRKSTKVVQDANYGTNRIWTNNPTFLLSGQLTGKQELLLFNVYFKINEQKFKSFNKYYQIISRLEIEIITAKIGNYCIRHHSFFHHYAKHKQRLMVKCNQFIKYVVNKT